MITSGDVLTLRKEGKSDDDILNAYKSFAPDVAGDIDTLAQEGRSPTDILNALTAYHESNAGKPKDERGVFQKVKDLTVSPIAGAMQEVESLGKTTKHLGKALGGDGSTGKAIEGVAEAPRPYIGNYKQAEVRWNEPGSWTNIPQAIGESLPAIGAYGGLARAGAAAGGAVGGAPGAVVGGLGLPAAYGLYKYLGRDAEKRATNNGKQEVTGQDLLEAIPGAAAQSGLDIAGYKLGGIFGKSAPLKAGSVASTVAKDVGRAAGVNALSGAASEVAGQLGTSVGTERGANINTDEVLNSGFTSGAVAGALKGAERAPMVANAIKLRGQDKDISPELVDFYRSTRVNGDPSNPKDSERVLQSARSVLDQDITRGLADDTLHPQQKQFALDMKQTVRQGMALDDAQVAAVKQRLAGTDVGKALLLRSEHNKVSEISKSSAARAEEVPVHPEDLVRYATRGLLYKAMRIGGTVAGGSALALLHNLPLTAGAIGIPFALMAANNVRHRLTGGTHSLQAFDSLYGRTGRPAGGIPPVQGPTPPAAPQQPPTAPVAPPSGMPPMQPPPGAGPRGPLPGPMSAPANMAPQPGQPSGTAHILALLQAARAQSKAAQMPPMVDPDIIRIKGKGFTRDQAVADISRSADAIRGGMDKRDGTRLEALEAAKSLPFADPLLAERVIEALKTGLRGQDTRAKGLAELRQQAKRLQPADRKQLFDHLDSFEASTGLKFKEAWGYRTEKAKEKGLKQRRSSAKAKQSKKKAA